MRKVITYGTYDLFHQGHYNILKRAKEYGDFLIVGVTADRYDVGRGKLSVHDSLAERIENVRKTGLVDLIIVEEYLGQKITDIIKYDVDVFVIGDDWKGKFDHIKNYCELVYLERTKGISSTQIREKTFTKHNIGIIADKVNDNQLIKEASALSSTEVTKVYSENSQIQADFAQRYGIDGESNSLDEFFENIDIVFVRCDFSERYKYVKKALQNGKNVICDTPFTLDTDKQRELFELAESNNLVLLDNLKMVYSQVFHQFVWIAQSGVIGDIIDYTCSVSKKDNAIKQLFNELLCMSLCAMIKVMGCEYDSMDFRLIREGNAEEYGTLSFTYGDSVVRLNIGNKVRLDNQIEIVGTKGTLRMDDNWWRAGEFELQKVGDDSRELFNMNFEGNGFKFLLKDMVRLIEEGRVESKALTREESIKIIEIVQQLIQSAI